MPNNPQVMISFLTPLADDGIGYSYGYVFTGTNLLGALLVWFSLYESVSLSLENVDLMYSEPGIKPWNSHKWMPPGYITRMQRDDEYFHHPEKGSDGLGNGNGSGEMQPQVEREEKVNARV
ncbi:hexose transporter hxt5 [Neurospora sp. IMI 360204]|nr:hexose transporter hxt5 [Neurospora sp. IMI 360204]